MPRVLIPERCLPNEIAIVRIKQSMPMKTKIRNRLKLWNPHRILGGQLLEAGVFQECLICMKMLIVFTTKFSDMLRKFSQILKKVEVNVMMLTLCSYVYD